MISLRRLCCVVLLVTLTALCLSACGRKIPLERPSPTPVAHSGDVA
ncbi:MAG: LPS translocon maturation chaperone LptM, partial [Alphaproteobacteria bacterium]